MTETARAFIESTPKPQGMGREAMLAYAARAGVPEDQIRRFVGWRYVPQPRQMIFHAAARACDEPDGPDEILIGGARGGGKSRMVFEQLKEDCHRYPGLKGLYLRKAAKQAKEQFEDLRSEALGNIPHEYKRNEGVVVFPNKSRIRLGHFADESDVDNYLGLQYDVVGAEELTTLSSTKHQALRDSTRTAKIGWRPRSYYTTNPGGIGHTWCKQRFIEPYRENTQKYTRYIPATLDDNAFIDEGYRRKIEENTGWRLRAYRYGDWDIAIGQYFTGWRYDVHVRDPFEIPNDWSVWASFDYGYSHPTVFHLFARDGDGITYVIDEHWMRRALPVVHQRSFYRMLEQHRIDPMRVWPIVAGTDAFSPRVADRGVMLSIAQQYARHGIHMVPADTDRVNGAAKLAEMLGDMENDPPVEPQLYVFRTCPKLIECIPAMETNENHVDDVKKWDVDDNGFGGDDAYDCFAKGTPILTEMGELPIEMVRAGDRVLTRAGWKPVDDVWLAHRDGTVLRLTLEDGREIIGTPNHPFWVDGKGFTYLDALRYGDIIETVKDNRFYEEAVWQSQKWSSSTESSFGAIQSLRSQLIASISGLAETIARQGWGHSTSRYGAITTERSQRDTTSIIATSIRLTTLLRTLSASRLTSICADTNTPLSSLLASVNTLLRYDRLLPIGMERLRGWRGTVNMPGESGVERIGRELSLSASNADGLTSLPIWMLSAHDSVPTPASLLGEDELGPTMLSASALPVASGFSQTSTMRLPTVVANAPGLRGGRVVDVVEVGLQPSYAIQVADQHEYYVNSLLVRNCCRYGIMARNVGVRPSEVIESEDTMADYDNREWMKDRYVPVSREMQPERA